MATTILTGDCRDVLRTLPDASVNCCVTSPPYFGLRDYGVEGQMGLEPTPDEYVAGMVAVFREVRRVLRDDGTLWLVVGDTYARSDKKGGSGFGGKNQKYLGDSYERAVSAVPPGLKQKDLIGIPWMLAFALRTDGWFLRQDIIWSKPNPMPESVLDRCTKAHEYLFLLSKGPRYHFDAAAIREDAVCKKLPGRGMTDTRETYGAQNGGNGGLAALRNRLNDQGAPDLKRNRRSVWTVNTKAYKGAAHFATFPPDLIAPCITAGCPFGGTVLDPFGGAGTTGLVANRLGRNCTLIELNPAYVAMAEVRLRPAVDSSDW